jgi:hypothetical protein
VLAWECPGQSVNPPCSWVFRAIHEQDDTPSNMTRQPKRTNYSQGLKGIQVMLEANRKWIKLLTRLEFPVVYPQQTVRGGEVLLIEDRNVMVLHSFLK